MWDVLTGDCEQKFRFPTPVLKVQFHPRENNRFLVCPMRHAAVMVELDGTHKDLPLENDVRHDDLSGVDWFVWFVLRLKFVFVSHFRI